VSYVPRETIWVLDHQRPLARLRPQLQDVAVNLGLPRLRQILLSPEGLDFAPQGGDPTIHIFGTFKHHEKGGRLSPFSTPEGESGE